MAPKKTRFGFVEYNGDHEINPSLVTVIVHQ
jgi:hypothetical protein